MAENKYVPGPVSGAGSLSELELYLVQELERIANSISGPGGFAGIEFLPAEPERKTENMVVGADGYNWNPGQGRGVYLWQDGLWHFLGGSGLTTSPEPPPPPGEEPPPVEEPEEPPVEEPPPPEDPNIPVQGLAEGTFHCLGVYWRPPSTPTSAGVYLQYKKDTETVYKDALNMWFDSRDGEARGSIVHLDENTKYDVRFSLDGVNWIAQTSGTTLNSSPPTNPTVQRPGPGSSQISISQSGTEDAWIVWDGAIGGDPNNRAVRDVNMAANHNFYVNANFIIIQNFVLREAEHDAIRIAADRHHVIVRNCHITEWGDSSGRTEEWTWGANGHASVKMDGRNSYILIERNKCWNPRYGSQPWDYGTPIGPDGTYWRQPGKCNVIRYNEFWAEQDSKWFHDGVCGDPNFGSPSVPGENSDIYGNIFKNCRDDGIEAEGGGKNVRIWHNYTNDCGVSIATAVVHHGPCYIWRNVHGGRSKFRYLPSWDSDARNKGYKQHDQVGSWGGGRRYVFHNSMLSLNGDVENANRGLGYSEGMAGGGGEPMRNTVSRNNIWHTWTNNSNAIRTGDGGDRTQRGNDFDYDYYNGHLNNTYTGAEPNGLRFNGDNGDGSVPPFPKWKSGHGPTSTSNFQLDPTDPAHDSGQLIDNFNDNFLGAAPDRGAHEEGSPPMIFGVDCDVN